MIQLSLSCFIEQFMAHTFIKFCGNILVSNLLEECFQLEKFFLSSDHRIVLPGNQKDWKFRISDNPSIGIKRIFLKFKQIEKTVVGENITTKRIVYIPFNFSSVAGQPSIYCPKFLVCRTKY